MALSDCVILTATETIDTSLSITPTVSAVVLSQGGVTVPALSATWAAPSDTRVIGVQFEFQESSLASGAVRTSVQGVALLSWSATDGLVAGKTYAVRYRAVGLETYGSWSTPANKTLSSTLTASVIVSQGDLATLSQADTPQLADRAAQMVSTYFSDSATSQVSSATTVKEIGTLTVTTTTYPIEVGFSIVDEVTAGGPFEYYISMDSTITHNGTSVGGGPVLTVPQDTGSGNQIISTRGFSAIIPGQSAGSHTFKLWVRNATGANWIGYQRNLKVSELKKVT